MINDRFHIESSFKYIERPIRFANDRYNQIFAREGFNRQRAEAALSPLTNFAYMKYDIAIKKRHFREAFSHYKNYVVLCCKDAKLIEFVELRIQSACFYPLVVVGAPFTALYDVTSGLVSCGAAFYRGDRSGLIQEIFRKQVIASAVQHFAFLAVQVVLIGGVYALIKMNIPYGDGSGPALEFWVCVYFMLCMGMFGYRLGQRGVGALPKWAQPDGFNIFIGGGALDEWGRRVTDEAEKEYQNIKKIIISNIGLFQSLRNHVLHPSQANLASLLLSHLLHRQNPRNRHLYRKNLVPYPM